MADKFAGGILAGSVDVSIPILLRVKSDGAELTGKVATAVAVYYYRQSAVSVVEISAATLGSMGAVHSNGGWFELDGTRVPGAYRLDLPDTAVSTGAEWVVVGVKDTAASGFMYYERFALETVHNAGLQTQVQSAVSAALVSYQLDHLLQTAVSGGDVSDDSVFAKLVSKSTVADWDTYNNTTESLEAIRDAGATLTDLGVINSTTIATLASQTSFTLTAGSADNDAYNNCQIIVTDSVTDVQKAIGTISDYTGATKTVTLSGDPAIFTMAVGDLVTILPPVAASGGSSLTYSDVLSAASSAWSNAAGTIRVYPADGSITAAVIGADAITSAKVAAGALVYDDQITTFKSELSGMVVGLPDGHITAAKIAADAITSAKVAAGAFTYDDQITTFKSELSGVVPVLTGYRLSTQGVRDITQYTSAMGGVPGSSPALIDALYWSVQQGAYKKIQTPTTALVHDAAGVAIASAAVSGTSTSVTVGIFTNV
jgi:hypothetical protein